LLSFTFGNRAQGLMLAGQALYHWAISLPNPVAFYFILYIFFSCGILDQWVWILNVMICTYHCIHFYWVTISCSWWNDGVNVRTGYPSAVFPSCLVYFSLRIESLELALQVVLPIEKETVLVCGSDLPLCAVAVQEFRLTNAGGIYQNLGVSNFLVCL
jgi:hypothetical protein